MSQDPANRKKRADGPYTTSITPLGDGTYGARIMKDGIVISQNTVKLETRQAAAKELKHMLRWHDKLGGSSKMASRSRDRFFCGNKRP